MIRAMAAGFGAFSNEGGAVVCYCAIGTGFERAKFERRMDNLDKALVEAFGVAAVSSKNTYCPTASLGVS
jgi:hypothetical protein